METLYISMRIITPIILIIISIYAIENDQLPKYHSMEWIKLDIKGLFDDKNSFGIILSVFEMPGSILVWLFLIWVDIQIFLVRLLFFIWNVGNKKRN